MRACVYVRVLVISFSAEPRPLPVQGEAKFSLRCRIWEMCGVTSPEERNLMAINGTVARCVPRPPPPLSPLRSVIFSWYEAYFMLNNCLEMIVVLARCVLFSRLLFFVDYNVVSSASTMENKECLEFLVPRVRSMNKSSYFNYTRYTGASCFVRFFLFRMIRFSSSCCLRLFLLLSLQHCVPVLSPFCCAELNCCVLDWTVLSCVLLFCTVL